jgi:hypothetical protein
VVRHVFFTRQIVPISYIDDEEGAPLSPFCSWRAEITATAVLDFEISPILSTCRQRACKKSVSALKRLAFVVESCGFFGTRIN